MASNYPHWFKRAPQLGSDPIGSLRWRVYNRTGGTTVVGQVYQFDLGLSTTSTTETSVKDGLLSNVTTLQWAGADSGGGSQSAWRNIVLPTTAFLRQGYFCRCDEIALDNEPCFVTVIGATSLKNSTTAVGDSTVTAGFQHFEPVTASALALYATAATTTSRIVFVSTGSFVISGSAIASVDGWFNGFGF